METNDQYHEDKTHVSASMLKDLDESPRVFEAKHVTRSLLRKPTASMEIGTAVHCLALEPDEFDRRYVVQPDSCKDRRTKAYKEWAAGIDSSLSILSPAEFGTISRCVASLRANPIIEMALQAKGEVEQSYRWTCQFTDVPCKFRPDKICDGPGIILDVKTMAACSQSEFEKQLVNFRYYLQAAHYLVGASAAFPERGEDWMFVFACVETSAPFRCRAFELDAESVGIGLDHRDSLLRDYTSRMASGDWSEPGESELVTVSLPEWFVRKRA